MLLLSMIIFNKYVFMTLISVLPYEQLDLLITTIHIEVPNPNQKYVCCGLYKERQGAQNKLKNNCPNVRF